VATLPWSVAELEATKKFMGEDYWSYGLDTNRHVLDTFTRYHHEQGISPRRVTPEELLAESTLDMAKN
jgi:4,5-dihydroxyphthalate decarboxylase